MSSLQMNVNFQVVSQNLTGMDMSWTWQGKQWHTEPYKTEDEQAADPLPSFFNLSP
jgi:hypothetical protein